MSNQHRYFGITVEGSIVLLGHFESDDQAESAAADYGEADACDSCPHASDDIVYWGTREHFNQMFAKLTLRDALVGSLADNHN